jgi:hypothetical protein
MKTYLEEDVDEVELCTWQAHVGSVAERGHGEADAGLAITLEDIGF